MKQWYVVGIDPTIVFVFGPFISETDARAYAIDLADTEEGFLKIQAVRMTHKEALELATDDVMWPYNSEPIEPEE